jgi:hypothetical protein
VCVGLGFELRTLALANQVLYSLISSPTSAKSFMGEGVSVLAHNCDPSTREVEAG